MDQYEYVARPVALHTVAALQPVTICQAFSLEWQRLSFIGNNPIRTIASRVRLLSLFVGIGRDLAELEHPRIEIFMLQLMCVASETKRHISQLFKY